MIKHVQNFNKYRGLLGQLVARDLKTKYRRSALGFVWSVLNPLMMMAVMTIVFANLFGQDIKTYSVFILSGQIIFSFFSEATSMSMMSIINASALIKKVYIPKYIFVLSRIISSFVNTLFSLVAVIILMLVVQSPLTIRLIFFPFPLIYVFLFSVGVGLILSAIAVYFRDIVHLYSVFLTALMYGSAIFYPPQKLISGGAGFILRFNPVYRFIKMFRDCIYVPPATDAPYIPAIPTLNEHLICVFIVGITLVIGAWVFYKAQDKFILYV